MREKVKVYQLFDTDETVENNHMLFGTMNDIRTWAKNLWKQDFGEFVTLITGEQFIEEDFYTMLDDDTKLHFFLEGAGYGMREICEVPFDDFYSDEKPPQELIDAVLEQIKKDIGEGDVTALDTMLNAMPVKDLLAYLPEAKID